MFHTITKNKSKNTKLIFKGLSALMVTSLLSGCLHDDDDPVPLKAEVNFVLASVEGGSCSLLDPYSNMTTIAGPAITTEGVAIFEDVPADTGLTVVECSGGVYEDEASGESMTPSVLRTYVDITSSEFTATVSPLTEIAARLIEHYDLEHVDFTDISANIAFAFGLKEVDLATVTPIDTNKVDMDGSPSSHYGLVLAAISQLQADLEWDTAEEVIQELTIGMANNGLFTSEEIRELYFNAIENTFNNPRIDRNEGDDAFLHLFFYGAAAAPLASQVEYVHAEHPDDHDLAANSTINAFETAKFDIVGTHLTFDMEATLAGEECELFDLQPLLRTNMETQHSIMYAECPAQAVGEAEFHVYDHDGRLESAITMTVVDPDDSDATAAKGGAAQSYDNSGISTLATAPGNSLIIGTVSGLAPLINQTAGAAHHYNSTSLIKFPIEGVTVQLVDGDNQVITSTVSSAGGNFQFSNAPDNTSVSIVVLAEIQKTRTTPNVGPEYNFTVRDNTSTTSPKKLHQFATPFFTTSFFMSKDVVAKVGFDDNGQLISDAQRESAPFAILRSVKAAAEALEALDANISMPALNIYWSPNNISTTGDVNIGHINTSHYAGQGLAPGLYILGKADADTDEFDQGVIGHEFGHYLQDKLSYTDSPGGYHASNSYKDASLAYGEGYGTALGGLLSGEHYYCDVYGNSQANGGCTDLTNKNNAGNVKGFYSEQGIITLLYAIGTIPGKGLNAFFDAMTKMKPEMHSATVFSFLHHYLAANPDVSAQVSALMAEHNIKTSDPFGILPAGTAADPAIAAAANIGISAAGAPDLETLYTNLTMITASKPSTTEPPVLLTPSAPTFCANRNLAGANYANGLGLSHRFTFTASFDGYALLKVEDKFGHIINAQSSYYEIKNDSGVVGTKFNYNGVNSTDYLGLFLVENGKKYAMKVVMAKPENVLNGSECGYKVTLAASFY